MIRGHLKLFVLKALGEGNKSGYALMKYIEQQMGHKPSSGSIYPILEQLKKENLVTVKEEGRKKTYSLTAKGRKTETELELTKEEMTQKIIDGLKMMTALTGEDMTACENMLRRVHRGEMPFKEFNPELAKFREKLFQLHQAGLSKDQVKKIKRIFADATMKLRKL
ncbi:PadR family transcriptional regulator [Candidatus Woesearchaeota archaeon]|nr:PadR family transcriptional regulator [Candidatus Woesearchaeota archaeon]